MKYPTQVVGNAAAVLFRVIRAGSCKLVGVVGHNSGAVDLYIQIHESAAPVEDDVPRFSVLAMAGLPYSFALPAPVDLDACTISASTDGNILALPEGTPITIQALLAA
jgi:hypothetical protein